MDALSTTHMKGPFSVFRANLSDAGNLTEIIQRVKPVTQGVLPDTSSNFDRARAGPGPTLYIRGRRPSERLCISH